jgi:hypothetical protein
MRVASPPNPVNVVTGVVMGFLAVMSALGLLLPLSEQTRGWLWGGVLYFSILAGVGVIGLVVYLVTRSRSVVIPKGLEIFDE